LLAVVGVASVGCSSGGGGGGAGEITICAELGNLCAQVSVARVVNTCGTSTASMNYSSAFGVSDSLDNCSYGGSAGMMSFNIHRACEASASDGRAYYEVEHTTALPFEFVREEVGGLGDSAFMRTSTDPALAALYVLRGNLVVSLEDYEPPAGTSAKPCLTTLAGYVLAAM